MSFNALEKSISMTEIFPSTNTKRWLSLEPNGEPALAPDCELFFLPRTSDFKTLLSVSLKSTLVPEFSFSTDGSISSNLPCCFLLARTCLSDFKVTALETSF